jgi:hypothetical protein
MAQRPNFFYIAHYFALCHISEIVFIHSIVSDTNLRYSIKPITPLHNKMVLTRRQTSYSSVENDFGGYEQNVNSFPTKADQFYPDPENRPARGSLSRKRPKKGTIFSRLFQLVQLIVLLLVGAYAYKTSKELEKTNLDMTALNDEYTNLHVTMSETAQELTEAQSMFVSVREKINRISPLPPAKSGRIDIEESRSLFQTILKRHDAQNDRITQLQKNIQGYHQHELEQG